MLYIILLSILGVILFLIIILLNIIFIKLSKRMPLKEFSDIDLSHSQYKEYENTIKEAFKFFKDIKYTELNIKSYDNLNLYANYYDNNSDKTIILVHGYRATPLNNFCMVAKNYYLKGYNILMIIQRSHGKSEGKYITLGDKEKRDLLLWIEKINELYNPKSIFIHGLSMGAATILLASKYIKSNNVKGLIIDCGFDYSINAIYYGLIKFLKLKSKLITYLVGFIGLFYGVNLFKNKCYKNVKDNKIPMLYIHGNNDSLVPIKLGYKNFNNTNSKKEFIETNAYHAMSIYFDYENIINKIDEFINNN